MYLWNTTRFKQHLHAKTPSPEEVWVAPKQGDQTGRIFAYLANVFFGQFFKLLKEPKFLATYFHQKKNYLTKSVFWSFFTNSSGHPAPKTADYDPKAELLSFLQCESVTHHLNMSSYTLAGSEGLFSLAQRSQ
jgi:hypothetical protein